MSRKRGKPKGETAVSSPSIGWDRTLFYGVVLLVFAVPLFIWPGISEYGYGKTIVTLIGVSALAILWGVTAWRKGTWTIRLPWICVAVLGFVVVSLLSLVNATNGAVVFQSLVLVVFFGLLMLIIANSVRDQRDANVLLFALLVSAFLAALYGMLQYLGVLRGPTGSSGLEQVISTMGNRNYLGGFLAYLLFPAVVLVVRPRSRSVRILSILLIAFCFGMVLVVQQSGTIVSLILTAVAFLVGVAVFRPIAPIRSNRTWLLALVGALVLTFLIEAPSGPLNSITGLSQATTYPSSTGSASIEARLAAVPNLIDDAGFENHSANWGTAGRQETASGDRSSGWWRLQRAGYDNVAHQLDGDGSIRVFEVRPGDVYGFAASLRTDGECIARVVLKAVDAQGALVTWSPVLDSASVDWDRQYGRYTVGPRVSGLQILLISRGSDGWAGFDNITLARIETAPSLPERILEQNSLRIRSWDWWIGWEMFLDHPVTGVGLGNYKLNFLPYKAEFLSTPRGEDYDFYIDRAAQAHNEYVQVLAELGILGALAVLSILSAVAVTLWKRLRSNDEANRLDLLLYTCGIVSYAIHALVSFPAHLPSSTLVLVVCGGLVLSRLHGNTCQFTARLTGWRLRASLLAVVVVGLGVSVVAVRDLKADLLMSDGIEQAQLGNVYGAEALFRRSLELDLAPRQTYYRLATTQIERGAYDEAQANLERCFTRFVDEAVYLNYANLTVNSGQYEQAREAIALLLATHPHEDVAVRARYLEAIVFAQTGDPVTATKLLQTLVHDAPWFETGYIGLGAIYQARGMTAEARSAFETALQSIDRKIDELEETLARQGTITAEEYGKLRIDMAHYQQERETVLDKLETLPHDETP